MCDGLVVLQQDCEYDSVVLRSGFDDGADGDGSGKVHGMFCGSTLPQPITSDGNKLRITFSTDNTVQKTGFSAVFFTGIIIIIIIIIMKEIYKAQNRVGATNRGFAEYNM